MVWLSLEAQCRGLGCRGRVKGGRNLGVWAEWRGAGLGVALLMAWHLLNRARALVTPQREAFLATGVSSQCQVPLYILSVSNWVNRGCAAQWLTEHGLPLLGAHCHMSGPPRAQRAGVRAEAGLCGGRRLEAPCL